MSRPREDERGGLPQYRLLKFAARGLGSLKLAVPLLVILVLVLVGATLLETREGAEFAQWYVYRSRWFAGLLALLGVNIFCAAASRYPWKRRQTGFVITHAGLLLVLTGAMQSSLHGVDGVVTLIQGEAASTMRVEQRGLITAGWADRQTQAPAHLAFVGGPVDWPEGYSRRLGELGAARLRITGFLRHAEQVEGWAPDASRTGGPALCWELRGNNGETVAAAWLSDDRFLGAEEYAEGFRLQLQQAASDQMLVDFLHPPIQELGQRGVLLAYYGDAHLRIAVDENVGRRIPLGETGAEIEIAEYLPNARPNLRGRFTTLDQSPGNPLLELKVWLPDGEQPLRQIAAAKNSLLTMDSVYGVVCPVKFRYYHPASPLPPGVDFLRSTDGGFYARRVDRQRIVSAAEVSANDCFPLPETGELFIAELLPHARRQVRFQAVDVPPAKRDKPESAVELLVEAGAFTRRVWLLKNDPRFSQRTVIMPQGRLRLNYSDALEPLGFSVRLLEFHRDLNPGRAGHAGFRSVVSLVGPQHSGRDQQVIAMNEPLKCENVTLYQAGFETTEFGHDVSILRATRDPGRMLKYAGGLFICLGIATMFYMRAYFFRSIPSLAAIRRTDGRCLETAASHAATKRLATVLLTGLSLFAASGATAAESPPTSRFDWSAWRTLAVQNGGRRKPLDTLAWETLRLTSNRGSCQRPTNGERLEPVAWYLSMLFDWSGWDLADRQSLLQCDSRRDYADLQPPDEWDLAPLLLCDYRPLRDALGFSPGEKHVSAVTLNQAAIDDPRTRRRLQFVDWVESLETLDPAELTDLERRGLDLARRLWAYQNHRLGRSLELLPLAGSADGEWISFAHLMLTEYDAETDPDGGLRRLQQLLRQLRQAYRMGDAEQWQEASAQLAASLRQAGSEIDGYPPPWRISLEVIYNHWAPFRFAWVLMLGATVLLGLRWASGWERWHRFACWLYGASLLAIAIGFTMRIAISGRAPVTNMYESVIYVGAGVALLGLLFEGFHRQRYFLSAAAAASTVALILADNCPAVLDPRMRPLEPVLRSNFWLITHVMTITLSYAAFALALGIANITLGHFLMRSENRSAITLLTRFNYKILQLGVLLLAAGILLGGVWADYSWGRFWGWDPKEVWALVALLGYITVLHARFAGWVDQCELAALTAFCFSLVIMAWYGVNFVLGAGLHTYGFGGGGKILVFSIVVCQLIYAALAMLRRPGRAVSA